MEWGRGMVKKKSWKFCLSLILKHKKELSRKKGDFGQEAPLHFMPKMKRLDWGSWLEEGLWFTEEWAGEVWGA